MSLAWGQVIFAAFLGWLTFPWLVAMFGARKSAQQAA